jgi:hypothetical protein
MKRVVLCVLASAACSTPPSHAGFEDAGGGVGFPYNFDAGTPSNSSSSSRGADASVTSQFADAAPPPPPAGHVRFADWAPDAPGGGFSFCLAPHGTTSWMAPFQPQGLAFPNVSAYASVPPGSYDAQLVIATSNAACSSGVITMPLSVPTLANGVYTTVAVIGDVTPSLEDPAMELAAFVDEESGTSGKADLRVLDVAPSLSYVNVGTGSAAKSNFQLLFASASFGTPATITAGGAMVDMNGYAAMAPLSGVELSEDPLSGGLNEAATASNVSLPGGSVATIAIVGGKTGGPPPNIMICDDVAAARGAASPCTVYSK